MTTQAIAVTGTASMPQMIFRALSRFCAALCARDRAESRNLVYIGM